MTALVIEGVSLLDLEALGDLTCNMPECDAPATHVNQCRPCGHEGAAGCFPHVTDAQKAWAKILAHHAATCRVCKARVTELVTRPI